MKYKTVKPGLKPAKGTVKGLIQQYNSVKNVEIKQKKKIGGLSLKPALKGLKKALGQNLTSKPGMKTKPVTRRGGK